MVKLGQTHVNKQRNSDMSSYIDSSCRATMGRSWTTHVGCIESSPHRKCASHHPRRWHPVYTAHTAHPPTRLSLHGMHDIPPTTMCHCTTRENHPTTTQPTVQLWDVVQYKTAPETHHPAFLGVVQDMAGDELQVAQLYEESPGVWLVHDHSGATESVSLSQVQCVVEAEYMQRVDPDRISNPHGMCWVIVHGGCTWWLYMVVVHGGCASCQYWCVNWCQCTYIVC